MSLNDLKPAWKQFKVLNAFDYLESDQILSIIEHSEDTNKSKLQRIFFSIILFVVITMICQSG